MDSERASASGGSSWWPTLAMLVIVLLTLPHQAYRADQQLSSYRFLDRSWQYSMPLLLADGELAGRDFVYTYGPLYQLLHAPALLLGGDRLPAVMRFHDLLEPALSLVGVWLMLGWIGAAGWRRLALFAPFALVVAAPEEFHGGHLKPMGGLFLLGLTGHLVERYIATGRSVFRNLLLIACALIPPALSMYSFEFGVLALGTLVFFATIGFAASWRIKGEFARRTRAVMAFAAVAAVAGTAIAVGLSLALPGWREYLSRQLALAQAYSASMAAPMTMQGAMTLAVANAAAAVLLAWLAWQARARLREDRVPVQGTLVLVVLCCASLVFVRYGLTRSGMSHIFRAVMPSLVVGSCLLPAWLLASARPFAARWAIGCVIATLAPLMFMQEFDAGWNQRVAAWRNVNLKSTSVVLADRGLAAAAEAIANRSERSLAVFPHGAALNLLTHKRNACATLQFSEGAVGPLQSLVVERLAAVDDPLVAVLRRPPGLIEGGGAELSRNSAVFAHLLAHFQLVEPPAYDFFLLGRREGVANTWSERVLFAGPPVAFAPDGASGVEIPFTGELPRTSDVLRLRVRVAKTSLLVGKPGQPLVVLVWKNGDTTFRVIDVPPDGEAHDVLVSGTDLRDSMLVSAFQPDRWWRAESRLKSVQFGWQRIDSLSIAPAQMACEEVVVLERSGVEVRESWPGDKLPDDEIYSWCFGAQRPLPAGAD